jgi:Eukaryotic aspartyl protease
MKSPDTTLLVRSSDKLGLRAGFIDSAEFKTDPFYTPIIDTSGFWKINSMSAVVAGQVVDRSGNTAIADTGTTLCLVDKSLCEAIYSQIPGAKSVHLIKMHVNGRYDSNSEGYIFPISNHEDTLPAVSIGIGDPNSAEGERRFDIMPRDIAFAQAQPGFVHIPHC